MKIYTGTGDGGETGLFGGMRVPKDDPRVEAYGTVDEVNAFLGLARASLSERSRTLDAVLSVLQVELFDVGAELATPPERSASPLAARLRAVTDEQVLVLEQMIDSYEAQLEPLKNFILPGGSLAAAQLHVARTVARRAERSIVSLAEVSPLNPHLIVYMNRLSDLLFVMARTANRLEGISDVLWRGGA
jgi:cob(I)alamin adenosyltransferase